MIWWEWQKWLDSRYKWTNTWMVRPMQQISTGARLTTNARFSTTKTHKHMLKAVVMIIIVLCPGFIFLNWDNHWSFCLTDIFIRSLGKKKKSSNLYFKKYFSNILTTIMFHIKWAECEFAAVEQPVEAFTNILFSSGTTGKL